MQEQSIFDATKPNPFLKCHLVGASNIFLTNSKALRHKVLSLSMGQYESKVELPLKYVLARRPVCFVMLQLLVMENVHFKFEFKLLTHLKTLHFLRFSTECDELKETAQVTWIPLTILVRSQWINLCINLPMILNELRSMGTVKSLESIAVYASCQLSRIALSKYEYQDTTHLLSGNEDVPLVTQVLDLAKIRISQWKQSSSVKTEDACVPVAEKKLEHVQVTKTKYRPTLPINSGVYRPNHVDQSQSASYKHRGCGDNSPDVDQRTSQPRCYSASSSMGRTKSAQAVERAQSKSGVSKSPSSSATAFNQPEDQVGRTGNLYLFNSLPQATPTQAWKKLNSNTKDEHSSPWSFEHLLSAKSLGVQRVSVDRDAIREITDKEVELKAALAGVPSPRTAGKSFKSPNLLSPLMVNSKTHGIATSIGTSKSPSPRPSPVTDELSSIAAPLDLHEYIQSDDLSASFEASLLASLKEAATGATCRHSDLKFCMEDNGIANAFTPGNKSTNMSEKQRPSQAELKPRLKIPSHQGKPNSTRQSPLPQTPQTPENLQLRKILESEFHTDMSYSDDDTSMATTTAGLGSLIDFPFPKNQVHTNKIKRFELSKRKTSLNQVNTSGVPDGRVQFKDDTSIHSRMSNPANHVENINEGPGSSTASSSCWQLHSASSEPNLISTSQKPPCLPNEPHPPTTNEVIANSTSSHHSGTDSPAKCIQDTVLELLYDAILDCYYDPNSGAYYELA